MLDILREEEEGSVVIIALGPRELLLCGGVPRPVMGE